MACSSQGSPGSPETQVMEEEFQFLLCQGCQKEPRNPKLLPCLHTLCTDCLQENKPIGQCPICRAPISHASGMPAQDNLLFASLQAKLNTYQKIVSGSDLVCDNCGKEGEFWCRMCEEFLCVKCFEAHQRYLKRESHEAQAVRDLRVGSAREFLGSSRKPSNLSCPNPAHVNQILSIYCRECQKPICCICALLDSRHTGKHCDIKMEIQQRQQDLGNMSKELKKKEEIFKDAYSNLKSKADHLAQVRNETREHIQKTVEQIVQLIQKMGQELLEMVERQHQQRNEELEEKMQQTEAMLKRMEISKQLVEKMHLYSSDQEVMDMHPIIKGSLEELRKLQPLAVETSVQAGDFSECKASLQALLERVTGERGTSAPQRAPLSEESTATVTLSLEPLHPTEASHQQTHLSAPDREGLFSQQDPAYLPCAQAEPHPAKDGGEVWPANRGDGSPALLASPPAQARRNGEEEPTSGQLAEAASARPTDHVNKAHSLALPLKRKGVQTEAPVKLIKTEADADEWEQSAKKHQQDLLEQPGTSSSIASSSPCVTDGFSAAKAADMLENNTYKLCEPDDPIDCWNSPERDDSEEESTDCSLPDEFNISCQSTVAFSASSLMELDSRQGSLLFFDLKFMMNRILQLAVVDEKMSFTVLIQPLKSLPGLISKGSTCEIGMKTLFQYLGSVHKPILAGYDLWSPALPVLFQSLDLINKKEEFHAAVFGFLDILPLIKEKIPQAASYKLKNLSNTYICRQLNTHSPVENAKALRDLCTVLDVDPGEDPMPVLTCSNLECYASLQPLLNEKLLTKPSVQTLSMHNVSLRTLHSVYLQDPEKGLQKFCRLLNSQLRSSEKKIQKLSKIKAHFQSPQPAADELLRVPKSEPEN